MHPKLPLPRGWKRRVRSSVLHILTLSHGAVPASALSKAKTMRAGRAQGSGLRINAQLIDALSGYHVWADRFDEPLVDIFALQDKVVSQIVSALAINIKSAEATESALVETEVAEAYDAFLEGWELYRRRTPEDTIAAIRLFERAIELDPEYGRAYAGLAASYWLIEIGRASCRERV